MIPTEALLRGMVAAAVHGGMLLRTRERHFRLATQHASCSLDTGHAIRTRVGRTLGVGEGDTVSKTQ
jgi:hypothetical protein